MVLKSIVEDIGADRGILISKSGFQSGAINATEKTNITLTDFDRLKETAKEDLLLSLFHSLETRTTELKYVLHELFDYNNPCPGSLIADLPPEIDEDFIYSNIGQLSILENSFNRVSLKKPPYFVKYDDKTQKRFVGETLEDFIKLATKIIFELETILNSHHLIKTKLIS